MMFTEWLRLDGKQHSALSSKNLREFFCVKIVSSVYSLLHTRFQMFTSEKVPGVFQIFQMIPRGMQTMEDMAMNQPIPQPQSGQVYTLLYFSGLYLIKKNRKIPCGRQKNKTKPVTVVNVLFIERNRKGHTDYFQFHCGAVIFNSHL